MSKELIVFPRGQLTDLDRARLDEAGFVAIEADQPALIQRVQRGALNARRISGDALVMAALYALSGDSSSSECRKFVVELHRRLKQNDEGKQA